MSLSPQQDEPHEAARLRGDGRPDADRPGVPPHGLATRRVSGLRVLVTAGAVLLVLLSIAVGSFMLESDESEPGLTPGAASEPADDSDEPLEPGPAEPGPVERGPVERGPAERGPAGRDLGAPRLGEGDCIDVLDPRTSSLEFEPAACGTERADHLIALVVDSSGANCPGNGYASLTTFAGSVYCLVMDVRVGDCMNHGDTSRLRTEVACADESATIEITTVVANTSGAASCAPGSPHYIVYPVPERTVCWRPLER